MKKIQLKLNEFIPVKNTSAKVSGNHLMEACLNLARQGGHKVIWLGVWEHNPRAISFYEKWGFEKFGSHLFMLGNDLQTDLLMKKNLI